MWTPTYVPNCCNLCSLSLTHHPAFPFRGERKRATSLFATDWKPSATFELPRVTTSMRQRSTGRVLVRIVPTCRTRSKQPLRLYMCVKEHLYAADVLQKGAAVQLGLCLAVYSAPTVSRKLSIPRTALHCVNIYATLESNAAPCDGKGGYSRWRPSPLTRLV
jgi:hypothetical protein